MQFRSIIDKRLIITSSESRVYPIRLSQYKKMTYNSRIFKVVYISIMYMSLVISTFFFFLMSIESYRTQANRALLIIIENGLIGLRNEGRRPSHKNARRNPIINGRFKTNWKWNFIVSCQACEFKNARTFLETQFSESRTNTWMNSLKNWKAS